MRNPENVVELLQDLISISSVNPQGMPGTGLTGELAIAEYVADFLRRCGADVALEEILPGRPNVIAQFAPERTLARLAFAPHLDTVSVAGMTLPPFDPQIREGRLFGRGATDTKGPMAAGLWAMREWALSSERNHSSIEWSFLGLMNEEAGNSGAAALAARSYESDLVLVLEPTEMAVVTAQKGILWLEISTRGRACHASTPELGRNAIEAMGEILHCLQTDFISRLARENHPRLGATTVSVGTIGGGTKINIVPDGCRIEVDCRFIPSEGTKEVQERLEESLRQIVPDVVITRQRCSPPLDTSESIPWVSRLGQEAGGFASSAWYSDAGILSAPHCPCVCIGPGHIAQAHTEDEFISVDALEKGTSFFRHWMSTAERAV